MSLVTAAIADELKPGFRPFRSLVDMLALDRINPESFDAFVAYMKANATAFSRINTQSAYVQGDASRFAVAAVSGYTRVIGARIPTHNYTSVEEGLVGLGLREGVDDLSTKLEQHKQRVRGHFLIVGPLRRAIRKNCQNPTAAIIARDLNRSTRTLQRNLAKVHTTLTEEVRRVRIEIALELMATSSLTLAQIAREVGFGASKTFRAAFSREVGMLPAAWRAAHVRD